MSHDVTSLLHSVQYYGLYKKTKSRVDTAEMLSARRIVALSRVEVSYHDSKEQLGRTLPGFDENNDHFNGLIYYQVSCGGVALRS